VIRAGVYVRVSTDEQADEGLSLEVQEQRARVVALERGADVVEVYRDDGFSGTRFDRPDLQRMLADVDELDMVAVWRLDRLSRSVRDWAEMMELFADHACGLISVTESFDFSTPLGRAMLGMLAVWAQLFVDILRENVRASLQYRAESGLHQGREPYGYRYEDGGLVVVPDEAAVVRAVFARYLDGQSMTRIGHDGNREDWPSGGQGGRWSAQKVRRILRNPSHAGMIRFSGDIYEGAHDAIVSVGDWRRAQQRMAARSTRRGPAPQSLVGLYRCGLCGGRMSAHGDRHPTAPTVRYVCHTRAQHPRERRHAPAGISSVPADAVVRAWASHILEGVLPGAIEQAAAEVSAASSDERESIDREIAAVEGRLLHYHSAAAEGTLPLDMLRTATEPLVEQREALRARRAAIEGAVPSMPAWVEPMTASSVDLLFEHTSHEEQVELLSEVFEAIEVHLDWRLVIKHRAPLPDREVEVPRYAMRGDGLQANVERALGL